MKPVNLFSKIVGNFKGVAFLAASFLSFEPLAQADDIAYELVSTFPHQACFQKASEQYGIDVFLLAAIGQKESAYRSNVVGNPNRDGSIDYGVMQINSQWLQKLQQKGINREVLLNVPCVNIQVGAWILATIFYERGVSWEAVGAYNAGSRVNYQQAMRRYNYSTDIYQRYLALKEMFSIPVMHVRAKREHNNVDIQIASSK